MNSLFVITKTQSPRLTGTQEGKELEGQPVSLDALVVSAQDSFKYNPLRNQKDGFEAGVLALARLLKELKEGQVISVQKAEPMTPEQKAEQFADLKHRRSSYAWDAAYEAYLAAMQDQQQG